MSADGAALSGEQQPHRGAGTAGTDITRRRRSSALEARGGSSGAGRCSDTSFRDSVLGFPQPPRPVLLCSTRCMSSRRGWQTHREPETLPGAPRRPERGDRVRRAAEPSGAQRSAADISVRGPVECGGGSRHRARACVRVRESVSVSVCVRSAASSLKVIFMDSTRVHNSVLLVHGAHWATVCVCV